MLNESDIVVRQVVAGQSVEGTTQGDVLSVMTIELDASGHAHQVDVRVTDIGRGSEQLYVLGNSANLRTSTARQALQQVTHESGVSPGGGVNESTTAVTPIASGVTQSTGFEFVGDPVNTAFYADPQEVVAQQYDSALGLGQPAYQPPPAPPVYSEDPYVTALTGSFYNPPPEDPYGELQGSWGF